VLPGKYSILYYRPPHSAQGNTGCRVSWRETVDTRSEQLFPSSLTAKSRSNLSAYCSTPLPVNPSWALASQLASKQAGRLRFTVESAVCSLETRHFFSLSFLLSRSIERGAADERTLIETGKQRSGSLSSRENRRALYWHKAQLSLLWTNRFPLVSTWSHRMRLWTQMSHCRAPGGPSHVQINILVYSTYGCVLFSYFKVHAFAMSVFCDCTHIPGYLKFGKPVLLHK